MSERKYKIAIFASGSGSNAEEIIRYFENHPSIAIALLVSNNLSAFALERAKKFNVPTIVFTNDQFKNSNEVEEYLHENGITHIVLAGFLRLIPISLIQGYSGKIINIHPALLPKYGGKGMYGMKIHEMVRKNGDTQTGITIHEVNENYDEGNILFQAKCDVAAADTPRQIAEKIHRLEHEHYPKVIEGWIIKS